MQIYKYSGHFLIIFKFAPGTDSKSLPIMHFRLLIFLVLVTLKGISGQEGLDSLFRQDKILEGEDKVNNLIRISRAYVVAGDTLSIDYARQAYELARQIGYTEGMGKSAFFLGVACDEIMVDSAFKYYSLAEKILEPLNHAWLGYCYTNLARMYREKGWYAEAIDYGIKSTNLFLTAGDSAQLAIEISNMGYAYDRMGDFEVALKYQKRALPIAIEHCDDYTLGLIHGRIGIAYDELKKYDSAYFYNSIALNHYQDAGDQQHVMQTLSNIGNTFMKQNKLNEAEAILLQALDIRTIPYSKVIVMVNLGHVYLKTGRLDKAEKILDEAIQLAIETRQVQFQSEAYLLKHRLYEKRGQLDNALHLLRAYNDLNDSILNVEKTRQVAEMRIRFETEQKEKELLKQKAEKERLAKDKALAEIKVYNRNKWIIGISSLSLILLFFGLFIIQRTKRKTQAEKDAAIIMEREKGLDAVLEAQENERKRIAKDLHDGIGQQLSGLKLAWQNLINDLKAKNPEEGERLAGLSSILDEAASEARNISHQMMPRILGESGLIPALEDMLTKSLGTADIPYEFETYQVEDRFKEKIEISLYRVAQELINNIIKHSGAKMVSVQLFTNQGHLILIVEDNGKGMDGADTGEGHGLLNIKSRINSINGEVSYDPSPGSGTVATIRVPVKPQ